MVWGAIAAAAVPYIASALEGGQRGGRRVAGEAMASTEQRMALANLRGMLTTDPYNVRAGLGGYFSPTFDYWGGRVPQWRQQLLGAAQTTANPILRAVSEQVEQDFARRGLSTGGAAGAARARAQFDVASRIALPVEQEMVQAEQTGIAGKYGLQQYAMNLALGAGGQIGVPMTEPRTETALGGFAREVSPLIGQAIGSYYGGQAGTDAGYAGLFGGLSAAGQRRLSQLRFEQSQAGADWRAIRAEEGSLAGRTP